MTSINSATNLISSQLYKKHQNFHNKILSLSITPSSNSKIKKIKTKIKIPSKKSLRNNKQMMGLVKKITSPVHYSLITSNHLHQTVPTSNSKTILYKFQRMSEILHKDKHLRKRLSRRCKSTTASETTHRCKTKRKFSNQVKTH